LRNSLYVGNLDAADAAELKHLMSPFGTVRFAGVTAVEGGGPGTRFGIVEMQTDDEAEAAIKALDGCGFLGRLLVVRWATPAEQTACGHPAMFGAMNISNARQGEGAAGGGPDTTALPFGSEAGARNLGQ
jgi:RNA recognition motif-containing protein